MKKLIAALVLGASVSACAGADPVLITASADGTQYYGHPATFVQHNNGYSIMITMITPTTAYSDSRTRAYIGITAYDCARKAGDLYTSPAADAAWENNGPVNLNNPKTIADRLAQVLCEVGAMFTSAGVGL